METNGERTLVECVFPARVHMTPIDCNGFDFGRPGGGGVGLAVDCGNRLILSTDALGGSGILDPLIEHHIQGTLRALGTTAIIHYQLSMHSAVQQHLGLGSSAIVGAATVWAVSELLGAGLTREECARIAIAGFGECQDGRVVPGLDTGVGIYSTLFGGFVVTGADGILVSRLPVDASLKISIVDVGARRSGMDEPESVSMLAWSRKLDSHYRYKRAFEILMRMIPAVVRGDWVTVGDLNWDFQFGGTHVSMYQGYEDCGILLLSALHKVRRHSFACGLSSVGPYLFALNTDERSIQHLSEREGWMCWHFAPDNLGVRTVGDGLL